MYITLPYRQLYFDIKAKKGVKERKEFKII